MTGVVAGPAQHSNVATALTAEALVGEMVDRQPLAPSASTVLASPAGLEDPQAPPQAPQR
jgi:hypothetical protein